MESTGIGAILIDSTLKMVGIVDFRKKVYPENPTFLPLVPPDENDNQNDRNGEARQLESADIEALSSSYPNPNPNPNPSEFRFHSVLDYHQAYLQGVITPLEVARNILRNIQKAEERMPPMAIVISYDEKELLRAAQASTERYAARTVLSLWDGVPIGVKDELSVTGTPRTVGLSYIRSLCSKDASVVAAFRRQGALIFAKLNMHEIGMGVTGNNSFHGICRNPYAPTHHTGGSSSGSAAAVASGLCPVAIGADGGGSVRIPAGFCGTVGLKATYGRVSEQGAAPLCWSVAHVGPLASSALDCALAYQLMAGHDAADPNTLIAPAVRMERMLQPSLNGVRVGVYWPWVQDAILPCQTGVHKAVNLLQAAGAQVVDIEFWPFSLQAAKVAHILTICSEMNAAMSGDLLEHRTQLNLETRATLAYAGKFTALDYLKAQKCRTRVMEGMRRLFGQVDLILTPATGILAPEVAKGARVGESDGARSLEIMKYATLANLSGVPAIAFPVAYSEKGNLPISIQLMGKWWSEDLLLSAAYLCEQQIHKTKPQVFYDNMKK
jgi:Asp-tRNA(Asn)/Glu-tRNA(Gln) amidotransferase A subunit family amidase